MIAEPLLLEAGHGFLALAPGELRERGHLMDVLLMFEAPRKRGPRRYVIGVDVGDGLGQDRSVIEVVRVGTVEEPQEEVAQYVTDSTSPSDLANLVYAIGMAYKDADGIEALVAVETNNHGLSTQDKLQKQLGYQHQYIWEILDARNLEERHTKRIGWMTTNRTRPMILDQLYTALTTLDPITNLPDYLTHSPFLHEELKDFTKPPGGSLWEAEAARGCHDDAVMAAAIANYVAYRQQAGVTESMEERRHRRSAQLAIYADAARQEGVTRPDWRNSPATSQEISDYDPDARDSVEASLFDLTYDPRRVDY